jgi:hypothetical protein
MCLILVDGAVLAQSSAASHPKQRTEFTTYDEHSLEGFGPVSEEIIDALLATEEADLMRDYLKGLSRHELLGLFKGIQLHLADSGETEYLVLGKSPMTGGDCDWYWVVRSSGKCQPEIILFANTNVIDLLRSKTNGHKDIRGEWSAASGLSITTIYHYDGLKYRLAHKYSKSEKHTQ